MKSLEEKLQAWKNPVEMLRNAPVGGYVFPIQPEFTNWRDEQEAWSKSAALFDLSLHMTDIYFEGPDLMRLLSDLAVNSFAGFGPGKAKQMVCCNPEGYVIGDAILFGLAKDKVNISGRPSVPHWVAYNVEKGKYNVTVTRDDRTVANQGRRKTFRFQIQGPNAMAIMAKAIGGPVPEVKFFNITDLTIAGHKINALGHGMARTQGFELFGPSEFGDDVRNAIVAAGAGLGLRLVGGRAYSTVSPESGWIPSPMPAIFSPSLKAYREWLPANGFEANASLGGSFVSDKIEDYYQTPWDLGYGKHVKFDHTFIGRPALEAMAAKPHRAKVWLVWNKEDILKVYGSALATGDRYKHLEMPGAMYSTLPFDRVTKAGKLVGLSTYNVYTSNVRAWFSLAMLDPDAAVEGSEVSVVWGEPNGGTAKPSVERHVQTEVRATVHLSRPGPEAK